MVMKTTSKALIILMCIVIAGISIPAFAQDPADNSAKTGFETASDPFPDAIPQEQGRTSATSEQKDYGKDFVSGAEPATITSTLPRFGYEFFRKAAENYTPLQQVPVGADYRVGPGDSFRISIWGLEEGHYTLSVDRDGNLSLPHAGVIGVAGLSFEQARKAIEKAYSRYFTNFEINITMGKLRSITVYVVGNAVNPGAYTISSLSTLVNALLVSGGPGYSGSLRNIQVKRSGRVVSTFDAYELLLHGNNKNDIRLMPGDLIFIPPVGSIAGITGNVKKPAYYELKDGRTRLSDLISMAGGFTNRYFKGRVQVERTMGNQYRSSLENDLENLKNNASKNFVIQNGDLVKIYSVSQKPSKVKVSGAVTQPGSFTVTQNTTRLSDVIRRAGGPLYMASDQVNITRVNITQDGPVTQHIQVSLSKALQGDPSNDLILQLNDYIMVQNIPEWELYNTVAINGEVRYPGTYTIKKGDTLVSVIERAGGYTDHAFLQGAVLKRESVRKSQQKRIIEMTDRLEKELYSKSSSESSSSLSKDDAEIVALETEAKEKFLSKLRSTEATGRVVIRLEEPEILKETIYDLEMEDKDSLYIPRKPRTVDVIGSVLNSSSFIYEPRKTFSHYVNMAGGYSVNADRKRNYIIRADGSAQRISQKGDNPYVQPGDTVVVPEKIQLTSQIRETRDIVDIVYKVAVSAGVAINAFD